MQKNKINTFQYLSLVRYKGLVSILKKYEKENISIILDLEDSAQDLFSKKRTMELKSIGRKGLTYLAEKDLKLKNDIFIRINNIQSKDHIKDLLAIKQACKKGLKFAGIFLPKVSKFGEISNVYKVFKSRKIKMIPIIETNTGLKNLKTILSKDKNKIISHIHYGHFDYCLDQNLWPFPEPYHIEFWNIINPIIETTLIFKRKFIQTPFPLIKNFHLYWSMLKYLNDNYKMNKIETTLVNYDKEFLNPPKNIKNLRIKKMSKAKNYKLSFAKKIYNEYMKFKSKKKSFSLYRKRFIAPHQYLMAKKFLKYEQ